MTTTNTVTTDEAIAISPNYNIPITLIIIAIGVVFLNKWVGIILGIFGLFLLLQTAIIRLKFTTTALEVYRSDKIIRTFPYTEWENWQIFWQPLPILFYFKEVNSIHFLPIIFDSKVLRECLIKYCVQK